jgi:hypothetical protein
MTHILDRAVPSTVFEVSPAVRLLEQDNPVLLTLKREFQRLCMRGSGSMGFGHDGHPLLRSVDHLLNCPVPKVSLLQASAVPPGTVRAATVWEGREETIVLSAA